jgi:hypothetical protein
VGDKTCEMKPMKKAKDPEEDCCDRTKLIRDLQKAEGNPQCFGTANGQCERHDCAWRAYCLKE